jgi:hypothetical protein
VVPLPAEPAVVSPTRRLPAAVTSWFDLFARSPIIALTHPNKNELLLHLALVSDPRARRAIVLCQQVLPRVPGVILDPHIRLDDRWVGVKRRAYQLGFIVSRLQHHLETLLLFGGSCFKWWLARRQRAAEHRVHPFCAENLQALVSASRAAVARTQK